MGASPAGGFEALPKKTESDISASGFLFKAPRTVAIKRLLFVGNVDSNAFGRSLVMRFNDNADFAWV